jgi:hypothetical protein
MKGDYGSPFSLHGSCSRKNIFFHNRKTEKYALLSSGIFWCTSAQVFEGNGASADFKTYSCMPRMRGIYEWMRPRSQSLAWKAER